MDAQERELGIGNGVDQPATEGLGLEDQLVVLSPKGDDRSLGNAPAELRDAVRVEPRAGHQEPRLGRPPSWTRR